MLKLPTAPTVRLAAATAVVALTLGLATSAAGAFAGRDGTIVYSWFSLMESELGPPFTSTTERAIKAVDPLGGTPTTLRGCTQATGQPDAGDCSIGYGSPAVSPNGRLVAFATGMSLALMGIDGSDLRLLPAYSESDGEPAFSPNGRRLVFSSGPVPSVHHPLARGLATSNLAGGAVRQVTARGFAPAWSSRNWIAFLRVDGVYRVRPDGHGLRRLVEHPRCGTVAWSPAGTKLAFTCRDRLFVSNGDGSHAHRVVRPYLSAESVAWSPSGKRLVITTFEGNLLTIRPDGSHERSLVSGGTGATYNLGAGSADWQPLR